MKMKKLSFFQNPFMMIKLRHEILIRNKYMPSKPEILNRKIICISKIFKIEQVHLKFSNGNERVFERMISSRRGAVVIVPMLDDETLLLVREYAAGTDRYEILFPKGL